MVLERAGAFLGVVALLLFPKDVGPPPKITLKLERVAVGLAIAKIAEAAKISVVVAKELPEQPPISMEFFDVKADDALKAVCRAAGLVAEEEDGALVIFQTPFATVGGEKVPLVGAAPPIAGAGPPGFYSVLPEALAYGLRVETPRGTVRTTTGTALSGPASFEGDSKLVDLEVKDAPLREAFAALSKESGIKIVVDEAVSKEIKVTARVRKMALRELLDMLVNQANLTYAVGRDENVVLEPYASIIANARKEVEAGEAPRAALERLLAEARFAPLIHIVPRPELKVSGPGLALGAGAMGGISLDLPQEVRIALEKAAAEAGRLSARIVEKKNGAVATRDVLIEMQCPKCKQVVLGRDWKFCPHCGAKLPPPQTKKVVIGPGGKVEIEGEKAEVKPK
jgi:hypothetical protein